MKLAKIQITLDESGKNVSDTGKEKNELTLPAEFTDELIKRCKEYADRELNKLDIRLDRDNRRKDLFHLLMERSGEWTTPEMCTDSVREYPAFFTTEYRESKAFQMLVDDVRKLNGMLEDGGRFVCDYLLIHPEDLDLRIFWDVNGLKLMTKGEILNYIAGEMSYCDAFLDECCEEDE